MADAAHQVGVDLVAYGTGISGRSRSTLLLSACCMVYGSAAGGSLLHKLFRLADAVRYGSIDEGLAVEAVHGNLGIGCDDDGLGIFDFLIRQDVLGSARAAGLNLDPNAEILPGLLNGLRRHVSMGDAVGAGSNGQNLRAGVCLRRLLCLFCRLF